MKRTLSLLVALALVFSMIPNVFAADEPTVDFDGMINYITECETLTVPVEEGVAEETFRWMPEEEGTLYYDNIADGITVVLEQGAAKQTSADGTVAMFVVPNEYVTITVTGASDKAEFTVEGGFGLLQGTKDNPIILEPVYNADQTAATATIEVAAGATIFYGVCGMAGWTYTVDGVTESLPEPEGGPSYPSIFSVSNSGEATASYTITFKKPQEEVVITVPETLTFTEGDTATLSVTVTGATPTSYQWQRLSGTTWYNASVFANYTTATATAENVKTSSSGQYRCRMVIDGKSVYTAIINVTVNPAPVKITMEPSDVEAVYGHRFELNTVATGTAELTYNWQKWNVATGRWANIITKKKISVLADENAAPKYRCKVVNTETGDLVYTREVNLTIYEPQFKITEAPVDIAAYREHRVIFKVNYEANEKETSMMKIRLQRYDEAKQEWVSASCFKYDGKTYGVKVIDSRLGKYRFALTVGGRTKTSEFELTMAPDPVQFVNVPETVSGALNETVTLSVGVNVDANVTPSSYQWQLQGADGKWYNASTASSEYADLAVVLTSKNDGKKYRCASKVKHSEGVLLMYSDIITLKVEE